MNLVFALLVSDGYYVLNEFIKLPFFGLAYLSYLSAAKLRIKTNLLIAFLALCFLGFLSCMLSGSTMNLRYLLSQISLILACYSFYRVSETGLINIEKVENFAKVFVLSSLINYTIKLFTNIDLINKFMLSLFIVNINFYYLYI